MLLSSVVKLLTKILTKKVTDKVSLRRARIQAEQINTIHNFILRQLIEKFVKFNKSMFVFSMEQAFDRIRLRDVITILSQKKISYLNIIKRSSQYQQQNKDKNRSWINERYFGHYRHRSLQTNDSLSPTRFNLIINRNYPKRQRSRLSI